MIFLDLDSEELSYYKEMAKYSSHAEYYIILGNLYLLGDIKNGIKPSKIVYKSIDRQLSIMNFEEAAKRGSNIAHYNLGLIYQTINLSKAFYHMEA